MTNLVGMSLYEREVMPSILQGESGPHRHDTATEAHVVGVDHGTSVAITIHTAEVHRLTGTVRRNITK